MTVRLPPEQIEAGTEDRLRTGLRRYCELRLSENERTRSVVRHDGVASLGIGAALFAVGVILSAEFSTHHLPESVRLWLGSGVFLVVAWVGLWYPLDSLVFTGHPLARDRRALQALAEAGVEVVGQQAAPEGS